MEVGRGARSQRGFSSLLDHSARSFACLQVDKSSPDRRFLHQAASHKGWRTPRPAMEKTRPNLKEAEEHDDSPEDFEIDTPKADENEGPQDLDAWTPIYIQSGNNLGKFMAHSLSGSRESAPVKLLFHTQNLVKSYLEEEQTLALTQGQTTITRTGLGMEFIPYYDEAQKLQNSPANDFETKLGQVLKSQNGRRRIDCLIITSRSSAAYSLLGRLRHRLDQDSTILFVHTSFGMMEQCNKHIFRDAARRPTYMHAFCQHDLFSDPRRDFGVRKKGQGFFDLTVLPSHTYGDEWSPSARHMLRNLLVNKALEINALSRDVFMLHLLREVALRTAIAPLLAILGSPNAVISSKWGASLLADVLKETAAILSKLPEVNALEGVRRERYSLSYAALHRDATRRLVKMGELVRLKLFDRSTAQMMTEASYSNRFFIERATEVGIAPTRNQMIMSLVEARRGHVREQLEMEIPMA